MSEAAVQRCSLKYVFLQGFGREIGLERNLDSPFQIPGSCEFGKILEKNLLRGSFLSKVAI